jgi:uncharacterized protein
MLLCDTGVLLAAGNMKDHHHAACLALMRAAEGPLLVPSPVLGEIGYLLQSRVGPHAEVTFLKSFGGNGFHVAEVEEGDISRITELVEQYVGLPLGIVDAAVIAIAERLDLAEVATVDRKHFSIVRPRHVSAFRLLPQALRRLRATARTLTPNRPTDNDDRASLAIKGTIGFARTA